MAYSSRKSYRGGGSAYRKDASASQEEIKVIPPHLRPAFNASPQQAAFFDWITHGSGNAVLSARAGTGKTTSLIHGAERTTGNMIFLAFNNAIAGEIGVKLRQFGIDWGQAATFHATGNKAWRNIAGRCQTRQYKIRDIMDEAETPPLFRGFVEEAVSKARQWGVGIRGMQYPDFTDTEPWMALTDHFDLRERLSGRGKEEVTDETLESAIAYAIDILKASIQQAHRVIDFDDMIYMPLYEGASFAKFDWIFVDEAQDSNPTRREMAKRMAHSRSRTVFVGDPYQAIYGFTGADSDSIDIIIREWSATVLPLTVTYRCPKAVVSVARRYVDDIEAADTAPEGIAETMSEEDFRALGYSDLTRDTAILCRNVAPLVTLCFDLISRDIPCHVEGREIGARLIKLIEQWPEVRALETLADKINDHRQDRVAELMKRKKESQAEKLDDECEAIVSMIDRMPPHSTVSDLVRKIESLFGNTAAGKSPENCTLASIHKSKGREWPTVYWIGANKYQPSKYATQDWQVEQETNLMYVAATRAMHRLVEVGLE